jgi:hypothetical protein
MGHKHGMKRYLILEVGRCLSMVSRAWIPSLSDYIQLQVHRHPITYTEGYTNFWETGTEAMGVSTHLAADVERGTTSHLCGLFGGGGSPRPSCSMSASWHQPPPFVAEPGLPQVTWSPAHLALRVLMRRAGFPDARGADWAMARFKMDCAACMQGVKCVAFVGLRYCLYSVAAFRC